MGIIILILSIFIINLLYDFLSKKVRNKEILKKIFKILIILLCILGFLYMFLKDFANARNIYDVYKVAFIIASVLLFASLADIIQKNENKDLSPKKSAIVRILLISAITCFTIGIFFGVEAKQKQFDPPKFSVVLKNYFK